MQFYAFKLMSFPDGNPLPQSAGFLFQQYIVDAYCKAESKRLEYMRTHQAELRAESYKGLADYVHQLDAGESAYRVGKRVVLPSSYRGAPRALQQN